MLPLAVNSVPVTNPPVWAWVVFGVVVIGMLIVDLVAFSRRSSARGVKEAAIWTAIWIGVAVLFNAGIYFWAGAAPAGQFATAYLVEKALSVDNLFVFMVIFKFFSVPFALQHRVLFWGIVGALLMRGVMIGVGVAFIASFKVVIFLLAALLIYCGIKLLFEKEDGHDPSKSWTYRLAKRYLPLTDGFREEKFFVVENGKRMVTPLLLVLLVVETTDLVFAMDSIPACLGISKDIFIVYTSNIFAILGMRALYFLLAGVMDDMRFLKPALSSILLFIGVKMIFAELKELGMSWGWRMNDVTSLLIVVVVLVLAVVGSLLFPGKGAPKGEVVATAVDRF